MSDMRLFVIALEDDCHDTMMIVCESELRAIEIAEINSSEGNVLKVTEIDLDVEAVIARLSF